MLIGFLSGGQPIRQRKSKNDRMECVQISEFGQVSPAFEGLKSPWSGYRIISLSFDFGILPDKTSTKIVIARLLRALFYAFSPFSILLYYISIKLDACPHSLSSRLNQFKDETAKSLLQPIIQDDQPDNPRTATRCKYTRPVSRHLYYECDNA
jgi:hypothetical protein